MAHVGDLWSLRHVLYVFEARREVILCHVVPVESPELRLRPLEVAVLSTITVNIDPIFVKNSAHLLAVVKCTEIAVQGCVPEGRIDCRDCCPATHRIHDQLDRSQ